MSEPLHIAICEDLKADSEFLALKIKETGAAVKIRVFESGEAFLQSYQKGMFHLIFLDVYMGGMTGMEVAAAIRERGDGAPIAFTTTSKDHALEANRYRAILYIEKPVTADAVAHTLTVAEALRRQRKQEALTVTDSERNHIDIPFDDISHIEVLGHRCTVHLADGGAVKVRTATTIDELAALLPGPRFFRCHRSFIVNFDHAVEDSKSRAFLMANGEKAFVRVKSYEKIKKAYEDYLYAAARGGK